MYTWMKSLLYLLPSASHPMIVTQVVHLDGGEDANTDYGVGVCVGLSPVR